MKNKSLTKAEEQIMQYMAIGKAFLKGYSGFISGTETTYEYCFYAY